MNVIINGTLYNESEAVISVYDHGFLYGIGVFETFRTYEGVPFLLDRHLHRLNESCKHLGISYTPNAKQIRQQINNLRSANGLKDAYIRLSVSAGADELGLPNKQYTQPNVIMYTKPLPRINNNIYETGRPLQLLRTRRNTPESAWRLKSFHFINNFLGKRELLHYPWAEKAEGLFLNEQGFIAEGIVSNVFFVKNRILFTPSVDLGIVSGITRSYVIDRLSKELQLEVIEGHFTWMELMAAEEIFLTNSIQEIIPVCRLYDENGQSRVVGDGRIGNVTKEILSLYRIYAYNHNKNRKPAVRNEYRR